MKLALVVTLCALLLAGVWADDKRGRLSQGPALPVPPTPASPVPAPAAAAAPAAPRKAIVPPPAPTPAPAPAKTPADKLNSGADAPNGVHPLAQRPGHLVTEALAAEAAETAAAAAAAATPTTAEAATETEPATVPAVEEDEAPRPSLWSSLLPVFRFGSNPTARHLRRPEPTFSVLSADDADAAPPAPPKGLFGGLLDALFGPSPASPVDVVPLMPPPQPLVTPTGSGWFNLRPSSFFRSFLGPSPAEAMAADAASTDVTMTPSAVPGGPLMITITRTTSVDDDDANTANGEETAPPPAPVFPVSAGADLEDAGMHRVGGRSRLGKLFNRVMRFLHLRPRHHHHEAEAEPTPTADNDDDDDEPPKEDDDTNDDDDDETAATTDDDEQATGHRWRRRRHHGRGGKWRRWGRWHGHGGRRHHRACKRDARRLCPRDGDGGAGGFLGVVRCLVERQSDLSDGCRADLQRSRAFECADDAVRLCADAGQSRRALRHCLKRNRDAISAPCKAAILLGRHHSAPAAPEPLPEPEESADQQWLTPELADDDDSAAAAAVAADLPVVVEADDAHSVSTIEVQAMPGDGESTVAPHMKARAAAASTPTDATDAPATGAPNAWAARTAAVSRAIRHLPPWAVALLVALGVVSAVGVAACVVVTCRRRAAAARDAAAKVPRVVVSAPARSAVQFSKVAATPAAPTPTVVTVVPAAAMPVATAAGAAQPLLGVQVVAAV